MSSHWTSLPGLTGAHTAIRHRLWNIFVLHAIALSFLSLAACGDMTGSKTSSPQQTQNNIAPPNSEEKPLAPGSLGRNVASDGLPSLQPAKGTNVSIDNLFAEDIRDPLERTKRVETAVVELRRDFDTTLPAIKRLVAVEKDIQMLVSQLETLVNEEPQPRPAPIMEDPIPLGPPRTEFREIPEIDNSVSELSMEGQQETPAPVDEYEPSEPPTNIAGNMTAPEQQQEKQQEQQPVQKPAAKPVTPPTPTQSSGLRALDLRLGQHIDKTRMVIDLTGDVKFKSDLDNVEKLFVIELPGVTWSSATSQNFSSGVIQSMSTQSIDGGKGTRLIIVLRKETSVLYQSMLSPDGPGKNYRLVMDLKN